MLFFLFENKKYQFHVADSTSAAVISKTAQNYSKIPRIQRARDEANDKIWKKYAFFFSRVLFNFCSNQRFDRFGFGFINPFLRRNCSPLGNRFFVSFFFFFFYFLFFVHLDLRFSRRLCGCYRFVREFEKKKTLLKLNHLMFD